MVLLRDYLEVLEPFEYIKIFKNNHCVYEGCLGKDYLTEKDEMPSEYLTCKIISHETFFDDNEDDDIFQIGLQIDIEEVKPDEK